MAVIVKDLKMCICTIMFYSYKATMQMYFNGLVTIQILLFLLISMMVGRGGENIDIIIWFPKLKFSLFFRKYIFLNK